MSTGTISKHLFQASACRKRSKQQELYSDIKSFHYYCYRQRPCRNRCQDHYGDGQLQCEHCGYQPDDHAGHFTMIMLAEAPKENFNLAAFQKAMDAEGKAWG